MLEKMDYAPFSNTEMSGDSLTQWATLMPETLERQ